MREALSFETLHATSDFSELEAFANSFDHNIGPQSAPVVVVRRLGQILAYFQVCKPPVILPALHPEFCSPRDSIEIIGAIAAWSKIAHGSCLMASPDTASGGPFSDEMCEKLGFKNVATQMWLQE